MPFREDVSDETLDAVAEAIRLAECPHREGPFGCYDYSSYTGTHEGAHRVRDFRSYSNPAYGSSVHICDSSEEARRVYEEMTRRHIAAAAWDAVMASMSQAAQDVDVVETVEAG